MQSTEGHFGDRLAEAVQRAGTWAVIGIDPHRNLIPDELLARHGIRPSEPPGSLAQVAAACQAFSIGVLEVAADLVPAVKVQSALFEVLGPDGFAAQQAVLRRARELGLIVILDAKRADIGSTAEAYAQAALDPAGPWQAHAVTVNPYLGRDAMEPFVRYAQQHDRGVFILVRTSNPGAAELQEARLAGGGRVAELVAGWVEDWATQTRGISDLGIVGAVVGGTARETLRAMRACMPHAWLLVPGYGAQGATADDVVRALRRDGLGALVNSSRGILRAARAAEEAGQPWQEGVRRAIEQMIQELKCAAQRTARSV